MNNNEHRNIALLLKNIFEAHWDESFITEASTGRVFTYQQFFEAILNGASILREKYALKKGDTVCLLMNNSLELSILYFSSLLLGLVVVPIDPQKSKHEIDIIYLQLQAKMTIASVGEHKLLNVVDINAFKNDMYFQKNVGLNDLCVFDHINYDDLFLISFTSGSTGVPKGVMHSFGNLVNSACAFQKKFNFDERNVFYHNLPMTYMAGILNLMILPLIAHSKIVIGSRFSIAEVLHFWDKPIQFSVNTFWLIPTILSLLLKFDRGLNGVLYAQANKIVGCVGTAPLDDVLKCLFQEKYGIALYQSYGLSETLFVSTEHSGQDLSQNSVGEKLDGVRVSFAEDSEIFIDVPWMFLGYINSDTQTFFSEQMYRSGDLGELNYQKRLAITGRKKDLIIKGGLNISPKRVEDFISTQKVFDEFLILGLPDVILGEKIGCFYVGSGNKDYMVELKKLQQVLSESLGKDYVVDEFIRMDAIPKNSNGKIDKLKIKELYKLSNQKGGL